MTIKQRKERQNIQHIETNNRHRIGTGYSKTLETTEEKIRTIREEKDTKLRKVQKYSKAKRILENSTKNNHTQHRTE